MSDEEHDPVVEETLSDDQMQAIIEYSPFGELTQLLKVGIDRQEPGALIARIRIADLNKTASRWLVRGLTTNFYSFLLELSQQIPEFVELDDEYIYIFKLWPGNMQVVEDVVTMLAAKFFIKDIEQEISAMGPNTLRAMLEELATLLGDSANPELLTPVSMN